MKPEDLSEVVSIELSVCDLIVVSACLRQVAEQVGGEVANDLEAIGQRLSEQAASAQRAG